MRDRDLLSRRYPPDAPNARAAPPSTPADALRILQQTHGNRALTRSLGKRLVARQLATKPQTTSSAPPPPPPRHVPWAEQTTAANVPLANEIDSLEKLTDEELRKKYEEMAVKAAKSNDDQHAAYERQLEAVEFLAGQRGIAPLAFEKNDYGDRTIRRRDVRVVIEAGIRETGSLKKSIDTMTQTNDIKDDVEFIEREADAWGREFTSQAREIAQKMLAQSISQILDVLESYGLDRDIAIASADDIIHGVDKDKVVERIVNAPEGGGVWEPDMTDSDQPGPALKHRVSLAAYVRNLKGQQATVKKRQEEANRYVKHSEQLMDHVEDADKPAWEAAMRRVRDSDAYLSAMWAKAERVHPVLAAFRGGKTSLRDVDLGDLDQRGELQMTELLKNVLQKLADIGVVQYRLKSTSGPGALNPLSLPPVVAMTKAAMFVPEGTIRAGKVYDLVSDAQDKSITKYIAEGLIALIVVATLIPSGGTSLGIGISIVGAALSAASAVEDWETYKKQKLLVNTALDRAKALSNEEPSLVPLAIDLISLGLDGAPLIKAFSEGVALRNLIRAGEDVKSSAKVKKVIDELNEIGKTKGDAKLGEKAVADVQTAEKEAAAATKLRPPGSSFASVEEVRAAVRSQIRSGAIDLTKPNPEWTELWDKVDPVQWVKDFPSDANRLLQARAPDVWKLVRDPQVLEDAMAELWETAARDGITEQEALVRYFGGPEGMPEITSQDPGKFLEAMKKDKPMIDKVFTDPGHGAYTHMFQEYAIARKIGKDAARNFRQAIANATGPEIGNEKLASKLWDSIFDEYQGGYLNCPETLGPIIQKNLRLP